MSFKDLLKAFWLFIILALLGNGIATFVVTGLIPLGYFVGMVTIWSLFFIGAASIALSMSRLDVLLDPLALAPLFVLAAFLNISGTTVSPGPNEIAIVDRGQSQQVVVDSTSVWAPYDKRITRISLKKKAKIGFKIGDERLEFEVALDPTNSTVESIGKLLEKGEKERVAKLLAEKMERIKELEDR